MDESRIPWDFLKSYYKLVLPISFLIILSEESLNSGSTLNRYAREMVLDIGESADLFLNVAGGID